MGLLKYFGLVVRETVIGSTSRLQRHKLISFGYGLGREGRKLYSLKSFNQIFIMNELL